MNVFFSILVGIFCVNVWLTFGSALTSRLLQSVGVQTHQTATPALFLAIILLAFFNVNLVVGAQYLLVAFTLVTPFVLFASLEYVPRDDLKNATVETLGMLIIELLALLIVIFVFKGWQFWLHEGPNHDSLIYFEGMRWAIDRPLWIDGEAVNSRWGLGNCGKSGMWIGSNCSLYRGGTYSLAAWAQFFSSIKSGVGLFGLFAYAGLFLWMAIGMLIDYSNQHAKHNTLTKIGLTLLLLFSTSTFGALLNSNLATMLASACIAIVASVCAARHIPLKERCVLAGLWVAVCTHFYAESLFYAGLIVFIAVAIEVIQERHLLTFKKVMMVAVAFSITLLIFANFTLLASLNSLLTFKSISQGGDSQAWYLDAPQWTWVGSFIGGVLMAPEAKLLSSLFIAGLGTISSILALVVLWGNRRWRAVIIAIVMTSLLGIWFIEARSYRYGEHKILQLLGTTWCLLLAFAILQALASRAKSSVYIVRPFFILRAFFLAHKMLGMVILLCLVYVEGDFFVRGVRLMKSIERVHGMHTGIEKVLSDIRAGDIVLIDDSIWIEVEKVQKTHYLAFLIHERGAHAVMTDYGKDLLRGGYTRNVLNNTLSKSKNPDWYLSGATKSDGEPIFMPVNVELAVKTTDFVLSRVIPESSGLVVPSDGWYDCELTHCWTSGAFTLEVVTPSTGYVNTLQIDFDLFFPPADGCVTIEVNGKLLKKLSSVSSVFTVSLSPGRNIVKVTPDWETTSPFQRGMSGDLRKLFAAVKSVRIVSIGN